jgi:ACS family sodium-dependent inorganic phosphate cotransporter
LAALHAGSALRQPALQNNENAAPAPLENLETMEPGTMPVTMPRARFGRRHGVVAFTLLAMILAYTDRVNIAVAAVAMREELHWSQSVKGLVLSGFFVGYLLFQVASGALAQRFGGKRVLGIAVLSWSAFTLATPWAAATSVAALVLARVALGLGEAAVLPASYDLFSRWVPAGERGRAVGRFLCGIPLGQIAGFSITGFLTAAYGWPASFYLFGVLGVLWAVVFLGTVRNDPVSDPRVGATERLLLPEPPRGERGRMPWKALLSVPMVRAFIAAHFCHNWALFLLVSWLPSYFHEHLGLPIGRAGLYSALPWVTNFLALLIGGTTGDGLIARGAQALNVRRLLALAGLVGTMLGMLLLPLATVPVVALVVTCLVSAALGLGYSGLTAVPLEVTPRHAPVLVAASNTLATLPGIAGVAITGWLLDVTHTYTATFLLTAVIAAAGALLLAMTRPTVPSAVAL